MNLLVTATAALGYFIAAAGVMSAVNWIAMMRWRRSAEAHWTERARLIWPVRVGANTSKIYLGVACGAADGLICGNISRRCLLAVVAGFVGAILGNYMLEKRIFPSLTLRGWLRGTVALHAALATSIIVWVGGILLMPEPIGWKSALVFLAVPGFFVFAQWPLLRRFFVATRILEAPNEQLLFIIKRAAEKTGSAPPSVWLLKTPMANAVAFPLSGEIIFTSGLLEICDEGEAIAVALHEMAHLNEKGRLLVLRVVASVPFLPLLLLRPALHFGGLAALLLVALMCLLWPLLRRVHVRLEQRADASASEHSEARVYASALEKLYRQNQIPAVIKRQSHPNLYDRLIVAGQTPDFPRPKAPNVISVTHLVLWVAVVVLAVCCAARDSTASGPAAPSSPSTSSQEAV